MTRLLIRLYPERWRARYGAEFEALLEERPIGPFDVADILLGALDAQLHLRGRSGERAYARSFVMTLRIGGFAAILGGPLFAGGFAVASDTVASGSQSAGAAMVGVGSLALLTALVGLSAFQARVYPALSWAAFAIPALGALGMAVGAVGTMLGTDALIGIFFGGLMAFFLGSVLFAVATFASKVLSRPGALLVAVGPVLGIAAGGSNDVLTITSLACFALGWLALGVHAVRTDRGLPVSQPI